MIDVPYFSQWESRALISRFLSRELRAEEDPLWRNSGASSPDEYAQWSPHICGIACLKMLLAHRTARVVPLLELVRDAVTFGVYQPEMGDKGKRLLYRPFVNWIRERFQIEGRVVEHMESSTVERSLRADLYAIVAVCRAGRRVGTLKRSVRL
ncbi:hypothetical protein ACGTRS_05945, partial [Burkholderia semiarida]